MTSALPAARSALSRLVLVVLLLAGALCLLGAVSVDLARSAASAAVRDGSAAAGERTRAAGAQAGSRGSTESGPQSVRVGLRAVLATAGAGVVPDPDSAAAGTATAVLPPPRAAAAAPVTEDVHRAGTPAGVSDRAPPLTAGT